MTNLSDDIKRECVPVWPHTQIGYTVSDRPEVDAELKAAISRAAEEMSRNLRTSLYADDSPFKPSSVSRFRELKNRIHDAWLVLTGRAEIY